jgi:hypothetical protein
LKSEEAPKEKAAPKEDPAPKEGGAAPKEGEAPAAEESSNATLWWILGLLGVGALGGGFWWYRRG